MSDLFKHRHAKLGCMVLRLFPKVMQTILEHYVNPPWLRRKYSRKDFNFVFTDKEIILMDKLPNMDEFTIEICYKILRFENMLDEPKCKWGNIPHHTEIEIADDVQRLINVTNSIIIIKSREVTEQYAKKLQEEIKMMVSRIDSYLEQDTLGSMYNSLCRSETDFIYISQDLTKLKAIEVRHLMLMSSGYLFVSPYTSMLGDDFSIAIYVSEIADSLKNNESEKRERYSRLSIPIIEIFPNILRDVIRTKMPAKLLYQKCVPVLKNFYPEQQANIKELHNSNTYDSLDVTLIYQLLRQFSLIPSPTKGWGKLPDKVDINLGDDVERIRCYRNNLAHRSDTKIEKNEFTEYFDQFRDIGYRMDIYFSQTTKYELQITGYRICGMDTAMQAKYENAMKEIENMKLRFEKRPIKFYWGDDFDTWLTNLRSLLKDEKLEGRHKVRVQIIFQKQEDVDSNIEVLNSLTDEINEGLSGIEFIVATKGSIVLIVDILLEMLETDGKLLSTLAVFLEKILGCIPAFSSEVIDIVLLPVKENMQWNNPKPMREQVSLEIEIEAQLLATDDKIVEQLEEISDAILKHSNRSGTNQDITVTLLPINLENISTKEQSFAHADTTEEQEVYAQTFTIEEEEVYAQTFRIEENSATTEEPFAQAQIPVKYNYPFHLTLRNQLNINRTEYDRQHIIGCVKVNDILVFADYRRTNLICFSTDCIRRKYIYLSYKPWSITGAYSDTVAVSCIHDKTILIVDVYTDSVINVLETSGSCRAISYSDNYLYVDINDSRIDVMDLTGKVLRTIPLPSSTIRDITVDRDRLVCINETSVYCCSLEGQLIWKLEKDQFKDFRGVTMDGDGNVYVTRFKYNSIAIVSLDGKHYIEGKTFEMNEPWGIHFDKKENILFVSNTSDGKGFLFDLKTKLT